MVDTFQQCYFIHSFLFKLLKVNFCNLEEKECRIINDRNFYVKKSWRIAESQAT